MKTILIGFDAFDPHIFENLLEKNMLPHLAGYVGLGGYRHLRISNPAQSEVSWTSLATGLNPGGHGLFDFVHRNPSNYHIQVSLLPTSKSVIGTQFTQPHHARTFFDQAVEDGFPATSLWWPATFPARQASPIGTIPGLGTPDILGQLGVGSLFSIDKVEDSVNYKSRIGDLFSESSGSFSGRLLGPRKLSRNSVEHIYVDFTLEIHKGRDAILQIGNESIDLSIGEWSEIFEVRFKMGMLTGVSGITRAIVKTQPSLQIYFLPLQIHPNKPLWPYATPKNMIKQIWEVSGPFLTLGWPQDTTALEEDIISDEQFLTLCESVIAGREKVFMQQLSNFEEGVLAIVFDTLDRVQHMFFNRDQALLEKWYKKMDSLFGRILEAVRVGGHEDARILIMSDHGFAPFDHKVHVNRWLLENNWLRVEGAEEQKNLNQPDWSGTRAYAIGLNSIYLNLQDREGKGIVSVEGYKQERQKLRKELLDWEGPDGRIVLEEVWLREQIFKGDHIGNAPDLVMGYSPGYRASAETGTGGFGPAPLEKNRDKWNADHCINPASVPGVLLTNIDLGDLQHPSYRDIPELVLNDEFKAISSEPKEQLSDEDQNIIEERLKGLGYL